MSAFCLKYATVRLRDLSAADSTRQSEAYARATPDFGDLRYNYGNDAPLGANLAIASDQVAARFGCLAVTLEQLLHQHFSENRVTTNGLGCDLGG